MSHPRLSIIPAGAVTDRSLEPRDLQVLCLLGRHTEKDSGWCRRSQVKMAAEIDCGRASVQRSLERLVDAGWLQKKRPPWSNEEGQPSNSYMYRVILDRDDLEINSPADEDQPEVDDSHAEDASLTEECPPVGTPLAQPDGHPGAQPYVGTGAHTYVGTKNVPLERPPLERERDARARDRKARFLVSFEQRWPTAALDDRQRTAYAAESLTEDEEGPCLDGIAPFLDDLKRRGRKNVPAGWKYIEQKRWTLLTTKAESGPVSYPGDSVEAKALAVLYEIVGATDFFRSVIRRGGAVYPRKPVTPRAAALAQAPAEWVTLNRAQAAAWEQFVDEHVTVRTRTRLREHSRAPWPWPPSVEGKLYTETTGPPETLMTEDDLANFT